MTSRQVRVSDNGASACHPVPRPRCRYTVRMQTIKSKSRKGRVPKGERVGVLVRMPVELREECLAMCQREGLPLTDVVTRLVAEALGREAPAYCYPQATEELPLDRAS